MSGAIKRFLSSPSLDWLVFAICVMMWGSAFALLKIATQSFSPVWITIGRMGIATVTLLALLPVLGEKLPPFKTPNVWRPYVFIGVAGTALPYFLFAWAIERVPSSVVAICNGGSPFFTALLAHALLAGERLSLQRGLSILLAFAGLAVLVAPRIAAEGGVSGEALGLFAAIAGASCYAIANVQTKLAAPVSPAIAATIYCVAAFLVSLPAGLAAPLNLNPSMASAIALVVLGVFSTALGGILYVFLVRRRGPVFTSFTTYLMPLWALGLGVWIMGERPGWNAVFALALVLAGLALFNLKLRRR